MASNRTIKKFGPSGRVSPAPKKTTPIGAVLPFEEMTDAELIALAKAADPGGRLAVPNFSGSRPIATRLDAVNLLLALEMNRAHDEKEAQIRAAELAELEGQQ